MATDVECWDDDADFAQGDLLGHSLSTQPTSLSSRMSIRSESAAADEDWQVLVTPDDENSKATAIHSAKQFGIPIPNSVPQSALLGGAIKRLGKKKSRANIADDWGDDFDINDKSGGGLQLKVGGAQGAPSTPANNDDDFDTEWAEGSLGIRFGGTRRDTSMRGRSSSVSAMSPSMGSCMTFESEDDELNGLVLPTEPIDFNARLKLRQEKEKEVEEQKEAPTSAPAAPGLQLPQRTPADEDDDLLAGLDFDGDNILDKKRTLNRNIKVEHAKATPPPARTNTTTLTFTDKAPSRIPRPSGGSATKPYNLAPIHETGAHRAVPPPAPQFARVNQPRSTTTSAQLLRAKRSAPILGRQPPTYNNSRPPVPFLPAGISNQQSHHVTAKTSQHFRQPSDHERPASPPARSFSRMSISDLSRPTQSRAALRKEGYAPVPLLRAAVGRNTLTVPKRREKYGSGNELDVFDDLPTSATKESKFIKEPVLKPKVNTLRRKNSHANLALGMPERSQMTTPAPSTVPSTPLAPPTPRNGFFPPRADNTPRFARDTAASRIAREQRTGNSRPRSEGPILVPSTTNWKTQVALRSPHNSPSASRGKKKDAKGPMLIKNMTPGGANIKSMFQLSTSGTQQSNQLTDEKGMVYNAVLQRWEGNEHVLSHFSNPSTTTLPLHPTHKDNFSHHHHTNSIPSGLALGLREQNTLPRHGSPPRPALISQVNGMKGPRIERGMVFDPDRMKWLKVDPRSLANNFDSSQLTPGSVSIDDEDDPFAGIDDLPDEKSKIAPGAGGANKENEAVSGADWAIGEEFDLGPTFIRRQQSEEKEWRRWTEKWFSSAASGQPGGRGGEEWRWAIRRVAERA
jgi:hypothetical protein